VKILELLKRIWITGADVKLNGEDVDLVDYENTPQEIVDIAINHVEEIQNYLKSWESESKVNLTIRKVFHHFCGWQHNEGLEKWLLSEHDSLMKFHDWTVVLAKNGWIDIYDDYRPYQTDESNKLANELYERAVEFSKKH